MTMPANITISFQPTWQQSAAAYRLWQSGRRAHLLGWAIALAATTAALAAAFLQPAPATLLTLALAAFILTLAADWAKNNFFLPYAIKKRFSADPKLHESRSWRMTEEGLSIRSESFRTEGAWRSFQRTRENQSTLLIYRSATEFVFLPKQVATPDQLALLQTYLAKSVLK